MDCQNFMKPLPLPSGMGRRGHPRFPSQIEQACSLFSGRSLLDPTALVEPHKVAPITGHSNTSRVPGFDHKRFSNSRDAHPLLLGYLHHLRMQML
jgi:hypothetical protein